MSGNYPIFLTNNVTHIGSFGNADPLDTSQWTAVSISKGTPTALWQDDLGLCSDFFSIMHYRFLLADVGSYDNPQTKIMAAQVKA